MNSLVLGARPAPGSEEREHDREQHEYDFATSGAREHPDRGAEHRAEKGSRDDEPEFGAAAIGGAGNGKRRQRSCPGGRRGRALEQAGEVSTLR